MKPVFGAEFTIETEITRPAGMKVTDRKTFVLDEKSLQDVIYNISEEEFDVLCHTMKFIFGNMINDKAFIYPDGFYTGKEEFAIPDIITKAGIIAHFSYDTGEIPMTLSVSYDKKNRYFYESIKSEAFNAVKYKNGDDDISLQIKGEMEGIDLNKALYNNHSLIRDFFSLSPEYFNLWDSYLVVDKLDSLSDISKLLGKEVDDLKDSIKAGFKERVPELCINSIAAVDAMQKYYQRKIIYFAGGASVYSSTGYKHAMNEALKDKAVIFTC